MNHASKQLLSRIALSVVNLSPEEIETFAQLAPSLDEFSPWFADWVENLCAAEVGRRDGLQNIQFPQAQFVDGTDADVAGALVAAVCLMETVTTDRAHDCAFALSYFTAATAHVRLVEREIIRSN